MIQIAALYRHPARTALKVRDLIAIPHALSETGTSLLPHCRLSISLAASRRISKSSFSWSKRFYLCSELLLYAIPLRDPSGLPTHQSDVQALSPWSSHSVLELFERRVSSALERSFTSAIRSFHDIRTPRVCKARRTAAPGSPVNRPACGDPYTITGIPTVAVWKNATAYSPACGRIRGKPGGPGESRRADRLPAETGRSTASALARTPAHVGTFISISASGTTICFVVGLPKNP